MLSVMAEAHERLRQARIAAGYATASDAARSLDVKEPTYLGHENGSREFDFKTATKYGRKFGVEASWLLQGTGRGPVRRDSTVGGRRDAGVQSLKRVPAGDEFPPDPDPDEAPTMGSVTGHRGIPRGSVAQLDVTAGMGAGGLSIVNPGVPGRHGMTFAAEHIRDFWRLPSDILVTLGLRSHDLVIVPVQGDSMADTLVEGDFVFIDTRHRHPSPDGLYALTDDFGGAQIKRLEVSSPPHADEVMVRIISDNPRHAPKERMLDELTILGRVVRRFGVIA